VFQGYRSFSKNLGARWVACGQIHTLEPKILKWPVNLTVWRYLLVACELITQFFVCKRERNCSNYTENIRCHCTKFSCPGLLHTWLIHISLFCVSSTEYFRKGLESWFVICLNMETDKHCIPTQKKKTQWKVSAETPHQTLAVPVQRYYLVCHIKLCSVPQKGLVAKNCSSLSGEHVRDHFPVIIKTNLKYGTWFIQSKYSLMVIH